MLKESSTPKKHLDRTTVSTERGLATDTDGYTGWQLIPRQHSVESVKIAAVRGSCDY